MNVGFDILSAAVKTGAKGVDDLLLCRILRQALGNRGEGLVALDQAVKIRAAGGDDQGLAIDLMTDKVFIQFQFCTSLILIFNKDQNEISDTDREQNVVPTEAWDSLFVEELSKSLTWLTTPMQQRRGSVAIG